MKYFFDTEFIEDGKTIDLISIGIVCEDGREFYACSIEARLDLAGEWVRANVLPHLPPYDSNAWMPRSLIRSYIEEFVGYSKFNGSVAHSFSRGKPEFWAYYADYDWVVFCQLWGRMIDLPPGFPKFCMDLKQLSVSVGCLEHLKQETGEHNALEDARWNKRLYDFFGSIIP